MLGGAGGIGQPLSLLLKKNQLVTQLAVFDVQHAKGEYGLGIIYVSVLLDWRF